MSNNDALSANQKRALVALLEQPNVRRAAKVAGLNERTLWRYLSDETFRVELRKRQDELITATTAALVGLSGEAVETLREILNDPGAGYSVKARVALGWLKHARAAVELDDLAERVARLEQEVMK